MRLLVPLALATAVLPACITEDIRIAPPANFPASIESSETAARPLNRVISFTPTSTSDGGVEDFQPFDLDMIVRDPDIDQPLQFIVFVDGRSMGIDDGGDIPPVGGDEPTLRPFTYSTAEIHEDLRRTLGCHKIEILVSEAFRAGRPEPVTPGDLGTAVFWVATAMSSSDAVDMSGCPR